ncbi:type IV pili methyl-accepting chemotaxis transducer N-terminal domain-containing protein, partial [Escherichia coli]|nr:type IV pili methyl-accepting chemotaxis transducer N-terminal domain-containing protein [Escherichia coli]
ITFLVLALGSTGLTLWVSWQLEGGAAAVNEAGRLRMMSYRLALALPHASPADLQAQAERFERGLDLLEHDDPRRPLFVPR